MRKKHIVVGITGASGSILAKKTIEALLNSDVYVTIVATQTGASVFLYEVENTLETFLEAYDKNMYRIVKHDDFFDRIASGSRAADGMIIVPCSMGTLGKIASGTSDNLLIRVADVMIKEQKKIILAIRETPYNFIHIENMKKLSYPGIFIMPPVPLFYNKPKNLDEMYNQIVGRFVKTLGIESDFFMPWIGSEANEC